MVIMATATPDMPVASTGVYVATQIGAVNAFSFDLVAACSSFLYGMSTAARYIESGKYKKVLLLGADKMSSITSRKFLKRRRSVAAFAITQRVICFRLGVIQLQSQSMILLFSFREHPFIERPDESFEKFLVQLGRSSGL